MALELKTASTNVARDAHYEEGVRTLLLEGQRTNGWTNSEDFANAAWGKSQCSISANATSAPDGAATADKIVEDGTNNYHGIERAPPTLTDNTNQSMTWFVKADSRTWFQFYTQSKDGTIRRTWFNAATGNFGTIAAGHTARKTALANGWYRVEIVWPSGAGMTSPSTALLITTGDGVTNYLGDGARGAYVWGAAFEADSPFASSYIPTAGATVTRSADNVYFSHTQPPAEMTIYVKVRECGSAALGGGAALLQIGAGDTSDPRLLVDGASGYRVIHAKGGSSVVSSSGASIANGDPVELRVVLFADGSVQIHVSVNGGAESSGTQSAGLALAAAWAGTRLYLNSAAFLATGFNAYESVKVLRGQKTMAECRTA
ncbi:MAG: phage head spike fiber domain-containing protein [Gemmatimonadota bacterium]